MFHICDRTYIPTRKVSIERRSPIEHRPHIYDRTYIPTRKVSCKWWGIIEHFTRRYHIWCTTCLYRSPIFCRNKIIQSISISLCISAPVNLTRITNICVRTHHSYTIGSEIEQSNITSIRCPISIFVYGIISFCTNIGIVTNTISITI